MLLDQAADYSQFAFAVQLVTRGQKEKIKPQNIIQSHKGHKGHKRRGHKRRGQWIV